VRRYRLGRLARILTSAEVTNLGNGNHLRFVVAMNCLNGYSADIFSYSLAEALLEAPNGGAVAVWAHTAALQRR
jgi:hypothetical protein